MATASSAWSLGRCTHRPGRVRAWPSRSCPPAGAPPSTTATCPSPPGRDAATVGDLGPDHLDAVGEGLTGRIWQEPTRIVSDYRDGLRRAEAYAKAVARVRGKYPVLFTDDQPAPDKSKRLGDGPCIGDIEPAAHPEVEEESPAPVDRCEATLRAAIADCDRKLANYRALLDHEDAVTVAAEWIADTQRERKQLERQLGQHVPGDQLTSEQVKALVTALKDIVDVLADTEPADKTELYDQLGISLAYDPDGTVTVESRPRGVQVCVGGGT